MGASDKYRSKRRTRSRLGRVLGDHKLTRGLVNEDGRSYEVKEVTSRPPGRAGDLIVSGSGSVAAGRISGSVTTEQPLTVEGLRKRMHKHREQMTESGF